MLLDNKKNGKVGDTLKENIHTGSRLSIISALFSIYGFEVLKKELNQVEHVRLLFSKIETTHEHHLHFQSLNGDQFERRFKNKLNQHQVAKECTEWLRKTAEIKCVNNPQSLGQNLFHIQNTHTDAIANQGSSNFTTSGLVFSESNKYNVNMCLTDKNGTEALLEWFDSIWDNPEAVKDIKELTRLYEDQPPVFIYFLTLSNLFKEFLEDIKRGAKPHDQDSEIKRILRKKSNPELIAHLLKKDPNHFAWVKEFSHGSVNKIK